MKIELKNIEFSERMSEETNCFAADLYVNGKKVGYVKNSGQGGQTDYNCIDKQYSDTIRQAEAYCNTLPDINYGTFTLPCSLENVIDQLFENWLVNKEVKKQERKMKTCILIGVPKASTYKYYNFKRRLSDIPEKQLQSAINLIKDKLKQDEVILNTNLKELGITV